VTAPIPILLYHAVEPVPDPRLGRYTITRERFAAHLDVLLEQGWALRSISDLVAARRRGERLGDRVAAVTFDDGFASFAEHAWPELLRRSLPATLFVTTGTVGATAAWLGDVGGGAVPIVGWDDLRRLRDEGCDIGAHSVTHPPLDCIDPAAAVAEIVDSGAVLADRLGMPVTTFAYPHGHHDRAVRQMVIDAGYEGACGVKDAWSHADDDLFGLARLTIHGELDAAGLGAALTGSSIGLAPSRERLRTTVFRYVRRRRYRRSRVRQPRIGR
jgi:peptidoglycan/xylan/chitin deacetylase (PgdA/CDA1 family)